MNHGILFAANDAAVAEIWQMAMKDGEFVAIYTNQSMEHRSEDWRSILSERPESTFRFPDTANPDQNDWDTYGRFEPQYDSQFLKIFSDTCGWPSVALPEGASVAEAQRLLETVDAACGHAYWRLRRALVPSKYRKMEPKRGPRKVRDLFMPIPLSFGWACFPDVCHPSAPKSLFLSATRPRVQRVANVCRADSYSDRIIEDW